MKIAIIILLSILSFSCNENKKSDSEKNIAMNDLKTELNIEQLKRPELIGKWYSSYLNFDNKELKFYKKRKNIKNRIEYEFLFMKNGDVIFKDLTEQYICGNGILSLNKGNWKIHHEKHLVLKISGEYGLESSFEKELEYEILTSKENELNLKLDHILKSCYESFGGTIYID